MVCIPSGILWSSGLSGPEYLVSMVSPPSPVVSVVLVVVCPQGSSGGGIHGMYPLVSIVWYIPTGIPL